jgi:hypothetical protein
MNNINFFSEHHLLKFIHFRIELNPFINLYKVMKIVRKYYGYRKGQKLTRIKTDD